MPNRQNRRRATIRINVDIVSWPIYTSRGLNELTCYQLISSLETWRYPYWGAYSFERKLNAELWHRGGLNTFLNNLETLSYGTVMEVRLPCYLVLLSVDSKTRSKDSHIPMTQPINIYQKKVLWLWYHFVCVIVYIHFSHNSCFTGIGAIVRF